MFREAIFFLSQRLGYPDDRYKRLYLTGSLRESIDFDRQARHAAGDWSVRVNLTLPISLQGRTRQVAEPGDQIIDVMFAPLIEMTRLRQTWESGFHRRYLSFSASVDVLLSLRRERLKTALQFEFIEQGDSKRAVAATGTPLSARSGLEQRGSAALKPSFGLLE